MQLPWDEHFPRIVVPAWQAYLNAECRLTEVTRAKDQHQIEHARYEALREGGAASFYVHHYAEIVLRARPSWLPDEITKAKEVRGWLSQYCTMSRTERVVGDVALLGDVADALKHGVLTFRIEERDVAENDAVIVVGTGYGELAWGEGKFGGIDQVLIKAKSGTRAVSSVLQNVIDAWRRAAGISLPEIGAA